MSAYKHLAKQTIKIGVLAVVTSTIINWIFLVIGKIMAPVKQWIKDRLPVTEESIRERTQATEDFFRMLGQQCPACKMWVPRKNCCECCGAALNPLDPIQVIPERLERR